MIKVKFLKALYPYNEWDVADIKQSTYDQFDTEWYFELVDIKVDVKIQKMDSNKSMEWKTKSSKSL